jgi:hypothetical protein
VDFAAGVMGLEGEGAGAEFALEILARLRAGRFGVLQHDHVVDLHGHLVALDDDRLGPPFIVLRRGVAEVHDIVEAAGLFPVALGDVDLALETALRPAGFLILGVEVNASAQSSHQRATRSF